MYSDEDFEINVIATTYQNYYDIFAKDEEGMQETEFEAAGATIGDRFDHSCE